MKLKPHTIYWGWYPYRPGDQLYEEKPDNLAGPSNVIIITDENGEIPEPKIHSGPFKWR